MIRQKLVLVAFILGVVASPIVFSFVGSFVTPVVVVAQEPVELVVVQPVNDDADPKEVFLELARQKAALLTPEELARETQALQNELVELQASLKLREAERNLQQLIDQHPESKAAQQARLMLEGGRRVNRDADDFLAVPAPEFRSEVIKARSRETNPKTFRRPQVPTPRPDDEDSR